MDIAGLFPWATVRTTLAASFWMLARVFLSLSLTEADEEVGLVLAMAVYPASEIKESCCCVFLPLLPFGVFGAGLLECAGGGVGPGGDRPGSAGAPFEPEPPPSSPSGSAAIRTKFGNALKKDFSILSFGVPRMLASAALTSGM